MIFSIIDASRIINNDEDGKKTKRYIWGGGGGMHDGHTKIVVACEVYKGLL